MDRAIRTADDVLALLDGLFAPEADRWSGRGADWWDGFYADRSRPVPFFVAKPDENLVTYAERVLLGGRRALDLALPPHRRVGYLALLERLLAPGGLFGLTCFAAGAGGMGSELSDADFYREGAGLRGGLAYPPEALREIFSPLTEVELRRMRDEAEESDRFGEPFLWTALFRRGRSL